MSDPTVSMEDAFDGVDPQIEIDALRARVEALKKAMKDYMACHPPTTGTQRAVAYKARVALAPDGSG